MGMNCRRSRRVAPGLGRDGWVMRAPEMGLAMGRFLGCAGVGEGYRSWRTGCKRFSVKDFYITSC